MDSRAMTRAVEGTLSTPCSKSKPNDGWQRSRSEIGRLSMKGTWDTSSGRQSVEHSGWDSAPVVANASSSHPFALKMKRDVRAQASQDDGGQPEELDPILLFREASTHIREFSRAILSPVIADMLNEYPHEEAKTCITIDPNHNNYHKFLNIYNTCKKYQKGPDIVELLKHQTNLELYKLMMSEEERKVHDLAQDKKDPDIFKVLGQQIEHLANIEHYKDRVEQIKPDLSDLLFHKEVKLQENPYGQKYEEWKKQNDRYHNLTELKEEILQNSQNAKKSIPALDKEIEAAKDQRDQLNKEMQEEPLALYDGYGKALQELRIPNGSENRPKNWIVDSITIRERQELSDDLRAESLEPKPLDVQISFKCVDHGGASKGDAGQIATQRPPFKDIFTRVLQDQGITVLPEQEEFLSINSDARVFDLPTKWQQAFLIARGQAYESAREEGAASSNNPYSRSLPEDYPLRLSSSASNETSKIFKKNLSPKLIEIFKMNPNQEVNVFTITCEIDSNDLLARKDHNSTRSRENPDSRYACKEAYEGIGAQNVAFFDKIRYKDLSKKLNKKIQILRKEEIKEIDETVKLTDLYQGRLEPELLEKRAKSLEKVEKYAQQIENLREKLKESHKLYNAYYIMLGAPVVWDIVEKLPKDYTVSYIAIMPMSKDKPLVTRGPWLAGQDYQVLISIKRVDSGDERSTTIED